MTQKKIWLPLVIVAFVAGTIMASPQVSAANPVVELLTAQVIPKLDQIIADIAAIDTGAGGGSGGIQVVTFNEQYGGAGFQGGGSVTYTATSSEDFTLSICMNDDDGARHDRAIIKDNSGTTIMTIIPFGGATTDVYTMCGETGGSAGDSITITRDNQDGTKTLAITLVTNAGATASIT